MMCIYSFYLRRFLASPYPTIRFDSFLTSKLNSAATLSFYVLSALKPNSCIFLLTFLLVLTAEKPRASSSQIKPIVTENSQVLQLFKKSRGQAAATHQPH